MMRENKITAQKKYAEAFRFINNGYKELQLAKKTGEFYQDTKHVSVACGTAYKGVLKAMDGFFALRGIDRKGRTSIEYYRTNLAKLDKKMLDYLNTVYQILHLDGYYDEFNNVKAIKIGFEKAEYIIFKIKQAN